MNFTSFIKKLLAFDVLFGAKSKKLSGIKDANNLITDAITISSINKTITLTQEIPSYLNVDQYFRITSGVNAGNLFRVKSLGPNTIEVYESISNDSGSITLDARLWVVHDDPTISKAGASGSTVFNVNNTNTTGLDDGSGVAGVNADHYHGDSITDVAAIDVSYDNSSSGATGDNVQNVLDEIIAGGGSSLLIDTIINIFNSTPEEGQQAFSTDTEKYYLYQDSKWKESDAISSERTGALDMGAIQGSILSGYGKEYVSSKIISNCNVGSNSEAKKGAIRTVFANSLQRDLFQIYLQENWQTILTGVNIQTDKNEAIVDIEFTDFAPWVLSLITGNSDVKDINGTPIVQNMQSDMGAIQTPLVIDGGYF